MGILDNLGVKGRVLWATASTGRWFLMGGSESRGCLRKGNVHRLEDPGEGPRESCVQYAEREGKEG